MNKDVHMFFFNAHIPFKSVRRQDPLITVDDDRGVVTYPLYFGYSHNPFQWNLVLNFNGNIVLNQDEIDIADVEMC